MPQTITFDRFQGGLDLRKGASVSDADRLRVLDNCYVTTGRTIRKRPGLDLVAILESGTVGLRAGNGKLNTFYATGTVTHADSRFVANKVPNPLDLAQTLSKIHYADSFNGFLYVVAQYANGTIRHHYLDDVTALTAWQATTAYTLGNVRVPTVSNGYRYEVTTAGTSDGSEPTWPTTVGATVADGTVTWTCRGSEIFDANCPHTAAVIRKASKMFACKGDVVRFSATNAPRDWTTSSDAGFLGVGVQQSGSTESTALGEYGGYLAVFFRDGGQVWTVDPDPANMRFVQRLDVGCPYAYGAANMAGDVFFASYDGVRSVTTQSTTGNLIDVDVGSAIDAMMKPALKAAGDARSFFFRGGGQFWTLVGQNAYVYSFSRTSKISAWSRYTFDFPIDDVTELEGELYIRSGDAVYLLDEETYTDAGSVFTVTVEFPYLDFKSPGVLKHIHGMDAVMVGAADIAHRFDARNTDFITIATPFSGDSRPGEVTPVEICSAGIAPVVTVANDQAWELHALSFYFDNLTQAA